MFRLNNYFTKGVGDKAEIWSKEELEQINNSEEFNLDDLASGFEELGFNI